MIALQPSDHNSDNDMETPHTFAGNPLDRGEALRRDDALIDAARTHKNTRFLSFVDLKVATRPSHTEEARAIDLAWQSADALSDEQLADAVFLGEDESGAKFAVALDEALPGLSYTDCRQVAASLATHQTGIVAQARAQLDWHQRNPYCAQCGQPSRAERGGQIRRCSGCGKHIFPRTDPVAIMLIIDQPGGDRCLLGRPHGRIAINNFYTALAGFLDQGESLEEAVRREVWEEAGIRVGPVRYHSSQPWPFPSQLMIGCHGIATTHDIQMDEVEMADVQWFSREDAKRAVEENHPDMRVPGAMAIAHHLIRSWVYGEVDL